VVRVRLEQSGEQLGETLAVATRLTAILNRQLDGTGLASGDWVTLSLAFAATIDRNQLANRVAGALKVTEPQALAHITVLADADLLRADGDSPVTLTEAGLELYGRVRVAITGITERLWGDVPAADLATAGRVLNTVLERANAEVAAA
jgi:hypothetical protein